MMKLMAYADGELEGAERAEIEKLVESDEEAARIVNAMLGIGDFVRLGNEAKDPLLVTTSECRHVQKIRRSAYGLQVPTERPSC